MKKYIIRLLLLGGLFIAATTFAYSGINATSAVTLFSDDFELEDDANLIYWKTENLAGWHYWHVIAWNGVGGAHCMRFENTDLDQNDWLITNAINTENADNILLNFDNFYIGQGAKPKLFYTTNYTGNASESSWTEISYPVAEEGNQWFNTGDIILERPGSTVWFAFLYQAPANEGVYFLLDNFSVKSYTPPAPFTKVGSSVHFEFYTNLDGESSYYSGIQTDLENEYNKLAGIWNRPGINPVFSAGTKIKIYYSSKADIILADASTPKWKCGFHNHASREIYLAPLENQQQTGFYGNFSKLAVNEFAQLAISCKFLRENNSYFPPYFLEGFGLYESGFRPDRDDVIQYVNAGLAYDYIRDTADISTSGMKKSLTIANIEGQVLTPWSYLSVNPGASSFINLQWQKFLQHFYTKPESDRLKLQHSSEHFDFYGADSDQTHMTEAYSYFENACAYYIENYKFDPGHKFNVVFCPDDIIGGDLTSWGLLGGAGCGGDLVIQLSPNFVSPEDYEKFYAGMSAHEFFHIFYNHFMWEIPGGFWAEGSADFSARHSLGQDIRRDRFWMIEWTFNEYATKYGIDLNLEHISANPNLELDIYYLGDMFFEFLYQNYGGFENIMKFFNQGMDYSAFNATYDEIDNGYINYLKSFIETQTNLPEVETTGATDVSSGSAILNGNVSSDGGAVITQRGFYWSFENNQPGESDNILYADGTTGSFSALLSTLISGKTYYFRAFATNANGTSFGQVRQFLVSAEDNSLELPFFDSFEETISNDATFKNWTSENLEGWHYWHMIPSGGTNGSQCMRFERTDLKQNDWLITQAIQTDGTEKITLNFDIFHTGQGTKPRLFYSTDYAGNASESSWTEITYPLGENPEQWYNSGDIILDNAGAATWFAFQYMAEANEGIYFLLDNFSVKNYVPELPLITVRAIQGDGDASPYIGQQVHTQGRIIAANQFGFFMQDTTGIRCGIFVYAPELYGQYAQGNNISITAFVDEYNGKTELKNVSQIEICDKLFQTYMPTIPSSDIGEDYESVFVSVGGLRVAYKNTFNEFITVAENGDTVIVDNYLIQPEMEIGSTYKVNGIVDYLQGRYTLNPRSQAGIVLQQTSTVDITFSVDMRLETVHPDGVFINGSFSDWEQPQAMVADGTVWSVTLQLKPGENITYKFLNGNPTGWDTYENPEGDCSTGNTNDRFLAVPDAGIALETVCFNQCSACTDIETLPWLSIGEIQGDDDISPYVGQQVRTKGRIMAVNQHGFFIQDTTGVRSGIFVYAPKWSNAFAQGDHVELAATVEEYNGKTELLDVIHIDYTVQMFPTYMTTITGADLGEDYEGVIVTINGLTVVYKNAHDEYVSVTAEGDSIVIDNFLIQPEMEVGKPYNVIGIVDYLNGRFSLNPRAQQGIQLVVPDISIGIAGTFNDWGNAGADIQMVQNSKYEQYWTIEYQFTEDTELKFRNKNSWDVNWGSDVFPFGTGVQDGPNIPVPAGNYHIFFDSNTGEYKFEIMSPMLKIREIQGNGESSPYLGQQVKTQGRIMAVNLQGFFIQDTTGARSGIYVYAPELTGKYVQGDNVELVAMADEYNGRTELLNVNQISYTYKLFPTYLLVIDASEIGEDYEGVFVRVDGLKVVYKNMDNEYMTVSASGDSVLVDNFIIQPEMEIGKTYRVNGTIDYLNESYRLNPRNQAGIVEMDDAKVAITFSVDMKFETVHPDGVFINGSFSNWEQPEAMVADGTVWSVSLELTPGENITYKFLNGNPTGWDTYENPVGDCSTGDTNDRFLVVPNAATILETVCFNQCSACADVETLPWLSIGEIQGDGDTSPYVGQQIRTKGRIMAINQHGFFIQDTTGVRSGIFVYAPDWSGKFVQGDHVELAAMVGEYNGKTELLDVIHIDYTVQMFPTYMTTITGEEMGEDYEGVIVTINGLTVAYKNVYDEYVSVSAEGDSVIIGNFLIQPEMEIGKTYNVIGIVDYLNGRFSLNPRAQTGIKEVVDDRVKITFLVNMQNEEVSADGVFVAGSWDNWTTPVTMTADGPVYSATVSLRPLEICQYKFVNGTLEDDNYEVISSGNCTDLSSGNRTITVHSEDEILDVVCFGTCDDCLSQPETVAVKFQVNMQTETVSESGVYINGSWSDWNEPVKLTKEGYEYYTAILNLPKNKTFQYKYVNGAGLEWDKYENFEGSCLDSETGNRTIATPGSDVVLSPICFNQCSECNNNEPPYAYNDLFYIEEDSSLTFWLDARDKEDIYSNLEFHILELPVKAEKFSLNKGMVHYKPLPDFNGADYLTFHVSDSKGSNSDIARIEFSVYAVNDKPVAKSLEANAWNKNELVIDLAPYIHDIETADNELIVEFAPQESGMGQGITGGKISKLDGSRYKYVNDNPLMENDYVVYRVSDGKLRSYAQVITILNLPVPKSIQKVESEGIYTLNDDVDVTYGKKTELEFLGIDVELPLEELSIRIVKQPVHGSLVGSIKGSYSGSVLTSFYSSYMATVNENSTDSVVFEISDGINTVRGVQHINIQAIKVAPVITHVSPQFSNVNQPLDVNLKVQDEDIGNLTWAITSEPDAGFVFSVTNENTAPVLEITPPADFTGNSTITIKATDSDGLSDQVKFALTVSSANSLPEYANALSLTATEDEPYTFIFEASDLDNDSLVFTFSNLPDWINISHFTRNSVQLSGTPSYLNVGKTSVFATISDGKSQVSNTLSLTVLNVDNAPEIIQAFDTLYATVGDDFSNINLSNYFGDKDPEDVLIFRIVENSNASLLQTTVNGDLLTVFFASNEKAIAMLTIEAESNGIKVQSKLVVNVNTKITAAGEWFLADLKLYPNPVSDKLYISGLPSGNTILRIITPDGRTIIEQRNIDFPVSEIEVSSLPAGIYLLHIRNENEMKTQLFIKR